MHSQSPIVKLSILITSINFSFFSGETVKTAKQPVNINININIFYDILNPPPVPFVYDTVLCNLENPTLVNASFSMKRFDPISPCATRKRPTCVLLRRQV